MSRHPIDQEPKPPFPEQEQTEPELESRMDPKPDYGLETYKGFGRLEGKVGLITGGDSGIGRAVALAFAREGADVCIAYLEADEDAEETRQAVEDSGKRCLAVRGDISDPAHCRELVDRTLDELGRIDVLVNNAAFQMGRGREGLLDHPDDEIERIFRTNVIAMFYLTKAAVPHMEPGSTVINTASVQAFQPSPELLPYSATKGAIVTFTKGLGQDLIDRGIRANAVAPGPVWTPLIPMSFEGEKNAHFGEGDPMQRPAQPAEIAPIYVFLACDESRFVNGEVIGATGGKPLS
jgi:NAD(P)-dependent dehydrogenase (short-subunit alcohol dehydrogenase family)